MSNGWLSMQNARQVQDATAILDLEQAAQPQRRKIQSVERALLLLELLAEGKLRLNAISKAIGINVSTCHHLLSTLLDRGYVAQSAQDRSYSLGNKILELSRSHMRQFDIADIAMDNLRALNARTGETVHLAVLQGDELVTLAVLDSHHAVRVVTGRSGESDPAHASATGKAILAWLPEQEFERIMERHGMKKFTEKTIVDRLQLLEDLRHVRRNGFAIDNEEYQPGVICIGAAIRDHAGAVVGAFSCSMPGMRASEERLSRIQDDIKATARALSEAVGMVKE